MSQLSNLEAWPQLIMSFGPYAVLALFALWIAPRQLNICLKMKEAGAYEKRLSGGIAIVAWTVVLLMTLYVMYSWPPTKVYDGRVGKLDDQMTIVSVPPKGADLYIKEDDVHGGDKRMIWDYALVVKSDGIEDPNECVSFTVYWSESGKDRYLDYEVPLSELIAGRSLNITKPPMDKEDGAVLVSKNGQWTENARCMTVSAASSFDLIRKAYADNHEQVFKVMDGLRSPNKVSRAKARRQMRRLSNDELRRLHSMLQSNKAEQRLVGQEMSRRGL